jgi:hypothetical protein
MPTVHVAKQGNAYLGGTCRPYMWENVPPFQEVGLLAMYNELMISRGGPSVTLSVDVSRGGPPFIV